MGGGTANQSSDERTSNIKRESSSQLLLRPEFRSPVYKVTALTCTQMLLRLPRHPPASRGAGLANDTRLAAAVLRTGPTPGNWH